MTVDEVKKAVEQLKAQGASENQIIGSFFKMFKDGKLELKEFEGLVDIMGYHLTDDFKNMSAEEQKAQEWDDNEYEDEDDKKDERAPKEMPEGEGDKPDTAPKGGVDKDDSDEEKGKNSDDDSDEEEKAMKLFGNK